MSNAVQIRDASDVTAFKKMRAIQQNYVQLKAKQQLPLGGIPQSDMMALARRNATYIVNDSRLATVTAQAGCPECTDTVTYTGGQIVAYSCSTTCSEGNSYQPDTFQDLYRRLCDVSVGRTINVQKFYAEIHGYDFFLYPGEYSGTITSDTVISVGIKEYVIARTDSNYVLTSLTEGYQCIINTSAQNITVTFLSTHPEVVHVVVPPCTGLAIRIYVGG
jgi:hypothetical protein